MNVLVVGGSGLIGGDIALKLDAMGHDVTIMARSKPTAPPLVALNYLAGDYSSELITAADLSGFDSLVFCAAADIRNMPMDGSVTPEEFYTLKNDIAVPRFFAAAKAAGVERAVYISTFYPLVAPERIGECPYVTSRHNTEQSVCGLSSDDFKVCSLNPGFVWGSIDGLDVPHINAYIDFLLGRSPDIPIFAPPGGSNHITSHSVAQAALNALDKGLPGKSYLVGDENWSWKAFMELGLELAGRAQEVPLGDGAAHPFFPDIIMFAGAGKTVSFEAEHMDVLAYDRNQIRGLLQELLSKAQSHA